MDKYKHAEYIKENEVSDTALVFIHGILGSPVHFYDLIKNTSDNYSIYNLLLPGHGGNGKDFSHSSMRAQKDYVDNKISYISEKHSRIFIIGHSMGCLLAIRASLIYPDKIKGLFFLAIPLCVKISFTSIKVGLCTAFNLRPNDEMLKESRRVSGVTKGSLFSYFTWLPRFNELINETRASRKLIRDLNNIPVKIIQSDKDETVSRCSLRYLKNIPSLDVISLKHSGHFYYPPEELAFIINEYKKFISLK